MSNVIALKLRDIDQKASLKFADVANVLEVRPETVSRWNQGKAFPQPDPEQRLLELGYVVEQLADFYKPLEARVWLLSPQKLLDHQKPIELIRSGRFRDVLAVINELRENVYL